MIEHRRRTWFHQVNPSLKLTTLLVLFFVLLLIEHWTEMLSIAGLSLLLFVGCSGLPFRQYLWFIPVLLFIFTTVAIPLIFYGDGTTTIYRLGPIHISEESLKHGVLIALRTTSLSIWSFLFALTTRPLFLFYSLMQQYRLPPKYAYAFLAALHLIPQLKKELDQRRMTAKMYNYQYRIRESLLFYSLPVLSQAIRKAYQTAIAMEVKGFSLADQKRTFYYPMKLRRIDQIYLFIQLLFILLHYGIMTGLFPLFW